jgi:hypothetical protein
MVRRRRLKLAYLLGSLLLLAASLHAPTAYSAPGDPPAGSPSGAVYELPLQQGRADGAPKGGGATGAGGGGSTGAAAGGSGDDGSSSLYRTENNFGSSSEVPGLALAGSGGSGGGGGGASGGDGAGSGRADGTVAAGAVGDQVADAGNTSVVAGIVLIGAIGLLAVGVGALSRRASSRAHP